MAEGKQRTDVQVPPTVLSSMEQGMIVYDRELRYRFWNAYMERLTGVPAEAVIGRRAGELFPHLYQHGIAELLRRALSGETVRSPDTPYHVPATGKEGWVLGVYSPHVLASGGIDGVIGIVQEITARKQIEEALRESRERFRAIFEGAAIGVVVVDLEGQFLAANPAFQRLLGYPAAELLGIPFSALNHPDDNEVNLRLFQELVSGRREQYEMDKRYRHRDGSTVWVHLSTAAVRDAEGRPEFCVGMVEDITERKRVEEENRRLAAIPRESPNPVLECDSRGQLVYANPAAGRLTREAGLHDVAALLPPNHSSLVQRSLARGTGYHGVEASVSKRVLSWTYHPHPAEGTVHLYATDATERRLVEEQLRHDALHDALTGLPNRSFLMERLARAVLRNRADPAATFAVLFLDLDRFKYVNESLGHAAGDELLRVVAERLRQAVARGDMVARIGGDEFAVLVRNSPGAEEAAAVADRLQDQLRPPINLGGYEVFATASIGIALSGSEYGRPDHLLRNADSAMYRAKAVGGARSQLFDRSMHADAMIRLQMETDLRRGLDRQEFRVHYQPVVRLATGRIVGFEALVRWPHPERGTIAPAEFIPVAEDTGMIVPLGEWVLGEACRQAAQWAAHQWVGEPPFVSVNLSVRQFAQPTLLAVLERTLQETGLEPSRLTLEITESVIMGNEEGAARLLSELKDRGVQLSLDDFGTGYSSLSYLRRLPLDVLKIDRSFVAPMQAEPRNVEIVRTIITLARSLGVVTVGEGVETPAQLATLRDLGCEYAQGFLFSPAVDPSAAAGLLAAKPQW